MANKKQGCSVFNKTNCMHQYLPAVTITLTLSTTTNKTIDKVFFYNSHAAEKLKANSQAANSSARSISQTINKLSFVNAINAGGIQQLSKENQREIFRNDSQFSTHDFNNLFNSWKSKTEQFKLFMQIKHDSFGFAWCDSIMLQQSDESLNKLDFIRYGRSVKKKSSNNFKTNITKHDFARNKLLIKNKLTGNLVTIKSSRKMRLRKEKASELDKTDSIIGETLLVKRHSNSTLDEQIQFKNSFMTNDETVRSDQSRHINSMISENFSFSLNNPNGAIPSCNYFNMLPISPTLCHDYATTSFFTTNEMNVSSMLISNVGTNVEELFCDDL